MSRLTNLLKNPATRPRLVVWIGVGLLVFAVFTTVSVVGTSTNWFCTAPCHVVHEDNTMTFEAGSHVMQSCVACHEPVNADPITLVFMKIKVAPDVIPTVLGTFHLPMNENHAIALEMDDGFCTQCHTLENTEITPSEGIIINHDAHTRAGITCTSCHNRVAHPEEGIEYVLEGDRHHEDWLTMDACYRCHSLEAGAQAPGTCEACHTPGFKLVPASHDAAGWYQEFGESGGHAAAYTEEASRVVQAVSWAEGLVRVEHRAAPEDLGYEQTVNTCYTCHLKQFCTDCHGGVEMPHPDTFAADHGALGMSNPDSCAKCHARSQAEAASNEFCNACHHPQSVPGATWVSQHYVAVREQGGTPCFDCHNPTYCATCHVSGAEAARRYMREQAGK